MPPEVTPNPKRVAAGRRNRRKRGPLTAEGRERVRQAALANQPWQLSTGPRTTEGKRQSAANGKMTQVGATSVREARREVTSLLDLVSDLQWLHSEDLIPADG